MQTPSFEQNYLSPGFQQDIKLLNVIMLLGGVSSFFSSRTSMKNLIATLFESSRHYVALAIAICLGGVQG